MLTTLACQAVTGGGNDGGSDSGGGDIDLDGGDSGDDGSQQVNPPADSAQVWVENTYMSRDLDGKDSTSAFGLYDYFYLQVDLTETPDNLSVKAVWSILEAPGYSGDVINETEETVSDKRFYFELSSTDVWPEGTYQVELFLNGESASINTFSVSGDGSDSGSDDGGTGGGGFDSGLVTGYMTNDENSEAPMTVFSNTDTFYCIVDSSSLSSGSILRAVWSVVAVEGQTSGDVLQEKTFVKNDETAVHFSLFNSDVWPSGTYQVEIYVDDVLSITLVFDVL